MIQLYVSSDDIREMLDRYNSDMCDTSTSNAVSIALGHRMKAKYTPKIEFASNQNACVLNIGDDKHSLPQNLYWWLRDSESGIEVKPSNFTFLIPSKLLLRKKSRITHLSEQRGLPILAA